MPTYEYICQNCNHKWEEIQSMNEKPIDKCPNCSKLEAKRLISAGTGFILQGSGWAKDNYSK